jgi:hypothetical protein
MATRSMKFEIDFNVSDLIMTPEELINNYLFGLDIRDKNGQVIPYETYTFFIKAAQQEIEKSWSLKFLPQLVFDQCHFWRDDYVNWTILLTMYPVRKAFSMQGFVNTTKQISYPKEWLSVNKHPADLPMRQINLVPVSSRTAQTSSVYFGITPHLGFYGYNTIPNYWVSLYCTGFSEVPNDLKHFIGRMAAIPILDIGGSLILGAGIASMSVGLDGLSQSISTTSSAENHGYSSTIKSYQTQMKEQRPILEGIYKGIIMQSL